MEFCVPETGAIQLGDLLGHIINPSENRWKVHPESVRRGDEGPFYRRIHKRLRARIMFAAEREEAEGKKANRLAKNRRRNGPLGYVALNVLRFLLSRVNAVTGQLDPSHATIARETGHSIKAVADALTRLASAGFIQWVRRYVEAGRRGRKGPQLEQTSNAYRIIVPPHIAASWTDAPLPADEEWRRKADRAAFADMTRDPQFALAIESLGAAVQRECTARGGINPRFN